MTSTTMRMIAGGRRVTFTREQATLSLQLDRAAAARREAARIQDRASYLCLVCHGPDGYHTSECPHE